jgi:hypothetical protein
MGQAFLPAVVSRRKNIVGRFLSGDQHGRQECLPHAYVKMRKRRAFCASCAFLWPIILLPQSGRRRSFGASRTSLDTGTDAMDSLASPSSRWRNLTMLLITASLVWRVLYLVFWCPLDLAPDEAHYWDWSRHLDWSYYSKGPLVAVLIRLSCAVFGDLARTLTGNEMVAVRLPAAICGALLLWGVYRLTVEVHGNPKWGFAAVLLGLTLPILSAGASLMTIDAPYTCAWTWALVYVHRALFAPSSMLKWWMLAGLCIAVGVLAKYTMVLFVPMVGLFLLMQRTHCSDSGAGPARFSEPGLNEPMRGQLARPGFWVMTVIGCLGGLPILYWNMQNGWVTLQHARGHAGLQQGPSIHWFGPLHYFGLQAAVLLGYWFIAWAVAVWRYRPGREPNAHYGYLWWMSFPMFLFFALFSLKNGGGEANWPITAYISGMVLVIPCLASFIQAPRPFVRYASLSCLIFFAFLGAALSIGVHDSRLLRPILSRLAEEPTDKEPTPLRRLDPTCRLKGWQTLARAVDSLRERLRAEGREAVLASGHWGLPGEIAFYASGNPVVYCLGSAFGDRHSQYDLWRPNPVDDAEQYKGRTFILVGALDFQVRDVFERVEKTRKVVHAEDGAPIAFWYVVVGHGYRGVSVKADARTY